MANLKLLRHKLSEKLELPEDSIASTYRVQIIGNCAIICGAKKILKYKSEEISILASDATVTFTGSALKCIYFFEGTIEISGEISAIGFEKR